MERTIIITVEVDNNEHAKGLEKHIDEMLGSYCRDHKVFMSPLPKFFEGEDE